MKKIILLFCLLLLPQKALSYTCVCGTSGEFQMWASGNPLGWTGFITALKSFDDNLKEEFKAVLAAIKHGEQVKASSDLIADKNAAQAEAKVNYDRDDINRRMEMRMNLMKDTVRQDTPMHSIKYCDGKAVVDGATADGLAVITGAGSRREIKDRMRKHAKLDGRSGRGGDGIKQTRELRRKLATQYADYNMDQILPDKGMTYTDPRMAEAISEMIAMAMTPDPWPDPENLQFDDEKKKDEYQAALIMQDILKDPELDAVMDYLSMHIGTVPAGPIHNLINGSGSVNAGKAAESYKPDQNGNLSMADVYRAWEEHYMSPAMANKINSTNATSTMQQLLARMYLVMLDGNEALQNAVTILALKQSGAKEQIENMRTAFMNASRGSGK